MARRSEVRRSQLARRASRNAGIDWCSTFPHIRVVVVTVALLLALAVPSVAAPHLTEFPATLGCISETGTGGHCADGLGLAGVSRVATGYGVTPGSARVYAVSPTLNTLVVLEGDPVNGGLHELQCFSAQPRAGCTVARALAGPVDVITSSTGRGVYVAARDDDAVAVFERSTTGLRQLPGAAGCVALALAGCTLVPALDEPVGLGIDLGELHVVSRGSQSWVSLYAWGNPYGMPPFQVSGCLRSGPGATGDGCSEMPALVDPSGVVAVHGDNIVLVRDGLVDAHAAFNYGVLDACANATGDAGCRRIPGLRGARYIAGVKGTSVSDPRSNIYVSSPGAANVQHVSYELNKGFTDEGGLAVASPGPLALLPVVEDYWTMYYGGTHLYSGGDELLSFRRNLEDGQGRLEPGIVAARYPGGRVEGVAASPEQGESAALYATVPGAGAVIALRRDRPPVCDYQREGAQSIPTPDATPVPVPCREPDGQPLSYSVERAPTLGRIVGFKDGAALYEGPSLNLSRRGEQFSVRVSDGSDSAVVTLGVDFDYLATGPIKMRVVDGSVRMDRWGRIRPRVRCVSDIRTCNARLAAYRGRSTASHKGMLPSGHARRMRLRLSPSMRRSIRRHRKGVRLRVVATAADAGGGKGRASRRVLVRVKR